MDKYKCKKCGYTYNPLDNKYIEYQDLSKEWICPICKSKKEDFTILNTSIFDVLFSCVVGSINYNLNDENSDMDKKTIILPSFDQMYLNKVVAENKTINGVDYDYQDCRSLGNLLYKSNINYLEMLFSVDIEYNNKLNKKIIQLLDDLFDLKDEIVKMNLYNLYNSCIGTTFNNKKLAFSKNRNNKYIQKFGFDTKCLMKAYKSLDFLERFYKTNFNNFKKAIYYDNNEEKRQYLFDIKYNKYDINKVLNDIDLKMQYCENNLKPIYHSNIVNEKIKKIVEGIIKEIVYIHTQNMFDFEKKEEFIYE